MQKDYQKIFEEYQELKVNIKINEASNTPNYPRQNPPVDFSDDLNIFNELKKGLEDNLQFLTDEQLNIIKNDRHEDGRWLAEAVKILAGRKINN